MTRRMFMAGCGALAAQAPREERVERLVAGATPAIALAHLGFLSKSKKTVVYRLAGGAAPKEFLLRDIGQPRTPFRLTRPLVESTSELGPCLVGDFSDIEREAMYQITIGEERSVPFFIRRDLWRRTLAWAVGYYRYQRCGVEVPGVHEICHLDDARRRDTGEHVDVTGGWHDAGDLRKWMTATMMNGVALLRLAREFAAFPAAPVLDEVRWGNRYFLKMQTREGWVWHDAGGGVNGDNSDNHWTDNQRGTEDDRYINTSRSPLVHAMFATLEAIAAQAYAKPDPGYANQCLEAAERCWEASPHGGGAVELGWWTLAALELGRATSREAYRKAARELAGRLRALQQVEFARGQRRVRGYFRRAPGDETPLCEAVYSALPALALLEAGERDPLRMYLDEYVLPMAGRSAYRIIPYGVFHGAPTAERYRPLAGELTYRFFMPVRQQSWWIGTTSHLESHALLLIKAAKLFGRDEYRDLALRQLEWILGANPFGACLMTGEGMRHPYPHSRFVGLIPGGILNGIAGNARDEPVLDTENGYDWRTTEYWSPHNAWYIWAVAALEGA